MLPCPSAGASDDVELSLNGPLNVMDDEAVYDLDMRLDQNFDEDRQSEGTLKTRKTSCGLEKGNVEGFAESCLSFTTDEYSETEKSLCITGLVITNLATDNQTDSSESKNNNFGKEVQNDSN